MKKYLFILINLLFIFVGCSSLLTQPTLTPETTPTIVPTESPCSSEKVTQYLDEYAPAMDRWFDAIDLAVATPKINLSEQIENLQEIKREVKFITPPQCLQIAHDNVINYMEKMIEGLVSYMSDASDEDVAKLIGEANDFLNIATDELERINACAPNCDY